MPHIVVRQIPEEVHFALKARARREVRSAESVARDILRDALVPSGSLGFGRRLAAVWTDAEGAELDIEREPYELAGLE